MFSSKKSCKNPNDFEGAFFKTCLFQQPASGYYSFRDTCDGGYGALRSEALLKSGEDYYAYWNTEIAGNRWGDFSATVVDPINDTDFWTIQEYSRPHYGAVNGTSGRWGTWWGKISPVVFTNDVFANTTLIEDCSGTNSASLARATKESGETNHAGIVNSPSLWYKWTAPSTGYVRFILTNVLTCAGDFDSSSSDSTIAIYTGTSFPLTAITNRHGLGGTSVFFRAISNTTYRIAIAGYGGRRGTFDLIWHQTNAPMIVEDLKDLYFLQGTNVTFSIDACSEGTPTYWFRQHGNSDLNSLTNLVAAAPTNYFILSNVTTNRTGYYSILVSNSVGTATSRIAHLQVYSTNSATILYPMYSSNQWSQVITGIIGNTYIVEASTNLINWTASETNTVVFTNKDNTITNYPYRFYRVRTQ